MKKKFIVINICYITIMMLTIISITFIAYNNELTNEIKDKLSSIIKVLLYLWIVVYISAMVYFRDKL